MKLYHRSDCPFCWKVRLLLEEVGAERQEIEVQLGEKHPDVLALNPNATVPVLIDGDLILWESAVIVEYLADKFPGAGLMIGSPKERALIRQIHSYSDTKLGKVIFPMIKKIRESKGAPLAEDFLKTIKVEWKAAQELLTEKLADRDYFGSDFSAAECALIPRVTLAGIYGLALNREFEALKSWFERCVNRQSFAATMPQEFPGIDYMINSENSKFYDLIKRC